MPARDLSPERREEEKVGGERSFVVFSLDGRTIATVSNIKYQIVNLVYRGSSPIKKRNLLEPYCRPLLRVLWGS